MQFLPAGVEDPDLALGLLQEQVQVLPAGVVNLHLAWVLLRSRYSFSLL